MQTQSDRLGPLLGTPFSLIDVFRWNPMENFVDVFRQLLYDNRWPDADTFLICTIWAFASLAIGVWIFRKNEHGLAEAL